MNNIEKIHKEIERRKKEHMYNEMPITIGRYYEDRDLLAFIDLLLQEKPEVELSEISEKYAEKLDISKGWFDGGEIDDLIKESFEAGAKWQYQKDRGEFAKIKAKTWCEGFDAYKEQMLKDAVEADVNTYTDLAVGKSWAEFVVRMPTKNLGDKVKIIILPMEEEK